MNWEFYMKKISDVCEVIAGQSPQSKYYNKDGNGIPFYQGKKEFTDKIIGKPTTWTTKITKEAIQGDILMSVRAPVGPVNFCRQHSCIGRGLASIRASKKIDNNFLFYFLLKHESEIIGTSGFVFNSINKTQISDIQIPVPPIEEQKKIIEILDQAFESIDKAKANIEKNIENAKELFQSKLNQVFSQTGEGWKEKKIGEVSETIMGQAPSSKDCNRNNIGYPFVKTGQFRKTFPEINEWTTNPIKKVSVSDVLITVVGATIGKLNLGIDCAIGRSVAGIRPLQNVLDQLYLYYYLSIWTHRLREMSTGTAMTVISKKIIYDIEIPIPPISEQKEIVGLLDKLSNLTQSSISIYLKELANLEELKKSILQKAFSGELTNKNKAA